MDEEARSQSRERLLDVLIDREARRAKEAAEARERPSFDWGRAAKEWALPAALWCGTVASIVFVGRHWHVLENLPAAAEWFLVTMILVGLGVAFQKRAFPGSNVFGEFDTVLREVMAWVRDPNRSDPPDTAIGILMPLAIRSSAMLVYTGIVLLASAVLIVGLD